jgi:hypothetical protein
MRSIMSLTDASLRRDGLLLGTTPRFTIVYDVEEGRACSVPHDSIARILHPERRSIIRAREAVEKAKLEQVPGREATDESFPAEPSEEV